SAGIELRGCVFLGQTANRAADKSLRHVPDFVDAKGIFTLCTWDDCKAHRYGCHRMSTARMTTIPEHTAPDGSAEAAPDPGPRPPRSNRHPLLGSRPGGSGPAAKAAGPPSVGTRTGRLVVRRSEMATHDLGDRRFDLGISASAVCRVRWGRGAGRVRFSESF